MLLGSVSILQASDRPLIKIETERTSLIYQVGDNGRLYQKYLGKRLRNRGISDSWYGRLL